ncbi:Hypothetical protein I5071_41050 [Sandaracinus amylolyticus]|nr:Hypothetical protein I5071_41050 [Sandaracinus amylolyticus]
MEESAPTFPVCTFKRVFDTEPLSEVLTLSELAACFRRFELKPQLHQKIAREMARIDRALEQALAGEPAVGERLVAILEAGAKARAGGHDPTPAMRARAEEMRFHARASAKRDLRLWSPAVYREGWKERGSEGVTHVSCLVLDYDKGVRIPDAIALWQDWFHLVHTTWSHTPEHPKFRVILPLAVPVPAAKWESVWAWAERQAAGEIDPSMKGVAATYALPAVPHAEHPREALTRAAPLLDPRELGVDVGEVLRVPVRHAPVSPMLGDPEKEYVTHETTETVYVYDDPTDDAAWYGDAQPSHAHDVEPPTAWLPEPTPPPEPAPAKRARKPRKTRRDTVCVDFDGVLHSYTSGWKGGTVIPDPPVPGAIEWLTKLYESFEIAILSTRTREPGAADAMREWLRAYGLAPELVDRISFPRSKPPARVYIDDRGWRFEGTFPKIEEIERFEPWNKRTR